MEAEEAEQRVTYLLQEIDANICAAHQSATQICATVRRHHQLLRQVHEAAQVWRPLFESFSAQPAAPRRSLAPARTPLHPRTPRSGFVDASASAGAADKTREEPSTAGSEQTFKTTTLKRHAPPSAADDSVSSSLFSEPAPQLARTPLLPSAPARARDTSSSLASEAKTDWSPSMGSPPRIGMRSGAVDSQRQPRTPTSVISSVAPYNSPGVSKNLMKMGAFEYTPPRGGSGRPSASMEPPPPMEPLEEGDSAASVSPPEFSTVKVAPPSNGKRRISALRPAADPSTQSPSQTEHGSARKRKRSPSPVYPKTHYPTTAVPAFPSPAKYSSMRRKYSTADYSTPTRKRGRAETPAKTPATTPQPSGADVDVDADDEPLTPEFDMASPLLHTRLKAMTPHTPLSNRLVGASLDVGSVSQETTLHDYDDSINSGKAAPVFSLSIFPAGFQTGVGAVQIATLYSKFKADDDAMNPALSVGQLEELLPQISRNKIEILVDTLVSRRLLRPFVVEGTMFWQIPS